MQSENVVVMNSAVGMVALLSVAMAVRTLAGGWCLDRFDSAKVAAPFSLLSTLGLVGLLCVSGGSAGLTILGMGIAPPLVGYCYDRLGRYEPTLLAMVGMMAVTIVLYLLLGPYRYGRDLTVLPATNRLDG